MMTFEGQKFQGPQQVGCGALHTDACMLRNIRRAVGTLQAAAGTGAAADVAAATAAAGVPSNTQ